MKTAAQKSSPLVIAGGDIISIIIGFLPCNICLTPIWSSGKDSWFSPGGPGSTPGMGTTICSSYPLSPVCVFVDLFLFILFVLCRHCHLIECVCKRMLYTIQVSTLVHYFGGFSSVKQFGRSYVMPLWSLTYKAFWCVVLLILNVCSTKICIWTRPMGSSPIRRTS